MQNQNLKSRFVNGDEKFCIFILLIRSIENRDVIYDWGNLIYCFSLSGTIHTYMVLSVKKIGSSPK